MTREDFRRVLDKERKERLGVEPDEELSAEFKAAFSASWEGHLEKVRGLAR